MKAMSLVYSSPKWLWASLLFLLCQTAYADISGTVFLDYNLNGQLDSTSKMRNLADTMDISIAVDHGIAGAQVKAECVTSSSTTIFGPVTTDASGQFTLPTTGATSGANNCVLQLSSLPSGYSVGSQGGSSGENVLTQFVSPTATANFAVQEEVSYCQNNPALATNRYAYGQQTPNPPYAGNNGVANLFSFPYNSGTAGAQNTTPTGYDTPTEAAQKQLALAKDVGSVFGLGWHPASQSLFASAYMKPWTGFGVGGTGGIYRTDISNPALPVTSLYADMNQLFPAFPPTAGDDPYLTGVFSSSNTGYAQIADGSVSGQPQGSFVASGDTTRDNQDGQILAALGKTAFGDLDVSKDGKSIFTVNLADRQLYILPLQGSPLTPADASRVERYPIPFEVDCDADGVGMVDKQAFGLGEYQGGLYVATRCDTSPSGWGVWRFTVYRFDLQTKSFGVTPSLNYKLTNDIYYDYYGIPSDIAFDVQGNMVLAFRNIEHETGGASTPYGAVRRACVQDTVNHLWSMESNAACGGVTTAGASNGKGPNGGDFFFQEWPSDVGSGHHAASYGGTAQIPGFLETAYTIVDPFRTYEAGVAWLDIGLGNPATAGQRNRAYEFYRGTGSFGYPDNRPVSGKNGAIGDLEVLCDEPSIEIGNRVWQDSNGNGIQDAGEPPIAGVKVELFAQGANVATATPLATTVTDADGYYVFSSDPRGYPASGNNAPNDTVGANGGFDAADIQGGRASTASHKYGLVSLLPNTQYQVAIRNVSGASKQTALTTLSLTTPSQGADAERNSDGGLVGSDAVANVTTLDAGNHYHALDFGFTVATPPPSGCTAVTNTVQVSNVSETDSNTLNNTASVAIQVNCSTPQTDLKLTKTASKAVVRHGDTVTYTLTLTNESDVDATNVKVTDNLPTGVSLVGSTPSQGTFTGGVWDVGVVAAHAAATLTINVTVD